MSLWQSYRNLSPRTRLLFGAGIMAWAVMGQFLSDRAEQSFGYTPTEDDREKLDRVLPKIRFVEKDED